MILTLLIPINITLLIRFSTGTHQPSMNAANSTRGTTTTYYAHQPAAIHPIPFHHTVKPPTNAPGPLAAAHTPTDKLGPPRVIGLAPNEPINA
jgi:hypothetical protein